MQRCVWFSLMMVSSGSVRDGIWLEWASGSSEVDDDFLVQVVLIIWLSVVVVVVTFSIPVSVPLGLLIIRVALLFMQSV